MKAMIIKEFRELARDRRTVALLIALPIVLLTVFGYAANFTVETTKALLIGPAAAEVRAELSDNAKATEDFDLDLRTQDLTEEEILTILKEGDYSTVIRAESGDDSTPLVARTHMWTDGTQLFAAQAASAAWMNVVSEDVKTRITDIRARIDEARTRGENTQRELESMQESLSSLRSALSGLEQAAAAASSGAASPEQALSSLDALAALGPLPELSTIEKTPSPEIPDMSTIDLNALDSKQAITVAFNPDLTTSWVMIPGLIGLILTFVGTIVTAIGLVREREAGTLEQLAVMPLSPASIILGKIVPYLFLALLDAGLITALGVLIFNVPFRGSWWVFSLLSFVFVFVVLGFGILISSVSETTGQAIQMSMMVMMPQILLSGFIFPLDSMAVGVRGIGYCLPLTWFFKAAIGIFLKDATLSQILLPLAILCVFALVVFGAATARMAKSLRSGGASR